MTTMFIPPTSTAIFALRVVSPAIVLLSTLSLISTRPVPPQSPGPITPVVVAVRTPRRAAILALLSLSACTFFLDGATFVAFAVLNKFWPRYSGIEINSVTGLAAFAGLAALGAWKDIIGVNVWLLKRVKATIIIALALDAAQVILLGISIHDRSVERLLHFAFPAFRVLVLVPLTVALLTPRLVYNPVQSAEEASPTDSTLLLPAEAGATPSTGLSPVTAEASKYGTFGSATTRHSGLTTRAGTPTPSTTNLSPNKLKHEASPDPSWSQFATRLRRISPYLWPSKSPALQFLAILCILLVAVGRVVNFLVPLSFGRLVRVFEEGSTRSPWLYLAAYTALRFLQASGGLAAVRDTLWAPVMQYSDREMSQLSFDHLLNLSFAFHTRRKTGEILRILDRGAAINHMLELLLFNIVPTFLDIVIALISFCLFFEWTLALVIFFVMAAYVAASVVLTRWRTQLRRQMNDRDTVTRAIHTDCLLNYETVKYFGGERHEGERYREAVREYQELEYKVLVSLNLLNLVQNLIITLGLLVGSMIVALRVTRGQSEPYEFVFFVTYLAQLYGPLNMLGYIYRSVNQSLVDTEKLLKLLDEPTEVNDRPGAPDLVVTDGEIAFDNVSFSYDGRSTALSGVSFTVPKGSSVALVGESGSGKSTILRLLYRFYDLQDGEGRILIDGQDIRDVTQASLRKAIGVVPQDSVLFNSSIAYNIAYGKFGSSREEVEAAAKAAQMHDRILSFPDGYDTKVGERGVRLSGGEKQRVAIARTLLKNPPILLLDEATSALDTSTEKDIQKALQHLVEGRSSLSIAHRLSTISSADVILVLKDGQIVEQGSHSELLARDGVFANMWADQVSGSEYAPSSHKKEPMTGYLLEQDQADKIDTINEAEATPTDAEEQIPLVGTPEAIEGGFDVTPVISSQDISEAVQGTGKAIAAPVAFPSSESTEAIPVAVPAPDSTAPLAFPSTDNSSPFEFPSSPQTAAPISFPSSGAPLAFPASEDADSREPSVVDRPQSPGVTFQNMQTPQRTGTPDPESDGKRRRTLSTQGIQRLARRISITTRRQGSTSSSIPILPSSLMASLKREGTTASQDDGTSSTPAKDSPTGSVQSDIGKTKAKKKSKKDSKRKSLI